MITSSPVMDRLLHLEVPRGSAFGIDHARERSSSELITIQVIKSRRWANCWRRRSNGNRRRKRLSIKEGKEREASGGQKRRPRRTLCGWSSDSSRLALEWETFAFSAVYGEVCVRRLIILCLSCALVATAGRSSHKRTAARASAALHGSSELRAAACGRRCHTHQRALRPRDSARRVDPGRSDRDLRSGARFGARVWPTR